MRKSMQKNHNKANFKKPFTPPPPTKKHRFHPLKQDKIGTIFSNPLHRPFGPSSDPSDLSDLSDLSDTKSICEIYHQPCKPVRSVRSV